MPASAEGSVIAIDDEGATIDVAILADGLGIAAADLESLVRQGS